MLARTNRPVASPTNRLENRCDASTESALRPRNMLDSVSADQVLDEYVTYLRATVPRIYPVRLQLGTTAHASTHVFTFFKVKPSNGTQNRVVLQRSRRTATSIFQRLTTRKPMQRAWHRPLRFTAINLAKELAPSAKVTKTTIESHLRRELQRLTADDEFVFLLRAGHGFSANSGVHHCLRYRSK